MSKTNNNKNLTTTSRPSWKRLCGVLAGLALFVPLPVLAAEEGAGQTAEVREYFHQQDANTALMIRLEAFEAGFEARVFDPEGILLKASGVPSLAMGPIFQFIEPAKTARQIRIEVSLGHSTRRSNIDLRLAKFEQQGPDSTTLIKAYRLLSQGLEIEKSTGADKWTMKVVSLMQAANIFDYLGMEELQLWSAFYANYYLLAILGDPQTASEGARDIYPLASRAGLKDLALASLELEGLALVKLAAGNQKTSGKLYEQAQARLTQAAELAASMGFQYEQARTIYTSGLAFEYADQVDQAFAQFTRALDIAKSAGDTYLANQVRQHVAELHESRGDTTEAIALLQEIRATAPAKPVEEESPETTQAPGEKPDPVESREQAGKARTDREMVSYLFEQGRLLEKTFQHVDAAEVLLQALELNQRAPTAAHTGPVTLLLGKALYGAGQMDTAAEYLQAATDKTAASGLRNELEEAYAMLASIFRERSDFTAMGEARERQKSFLATDPARAAFAYEQALDALALEGPSSRAARAFLAESGQLARAGGANAIAQLALLQSCSLGDALASCMAGSGEQARVALEASGLPAVAFEGHLLWAQTLRQNGQLGESTAALDRLINDMQFFHTQLPGVLGAWYWQSRERVFTAFMDQTLQTTGVATGGSSDETAALSSLTALDRLSRFDAGGDAVAQPALAGSEELAKLRSTYAARAVATDPDQVRTLNAEAAVQLREARARAGIAEPPPGVLSAELRELPSDATFLTYYISDRQAWAWIGHGNSLSLVRLPWSNHQSADLSLAMENLRLDLSQGKTANFSGVLDSLGRALLAPVARQLQGTIYFFPIGSLEGVPLDALRVNGRYLLESHQVINLVSLDKLNAGDSRVDSEDLQRFYLAGNRQATGGDFAAYQPTPAEIKTIADQFVGPGLRIVQGSALHFDEFQDEQFTQAGVLHLAIPGVIDLRQPAESRLLLSDSTADLERDFLLPGDIAGKTFQAQLVVLSALNFTGTSPSAFDTNTRLVREFLHAGAGSVIASLWRVGDQQAAEFWRRFYGALVSNSSVNEALYQTKKSYIQEGPNPESGVWAAFQLFAE